MSKVIKALALMSAGLGGYMQGRNQFEDRQAREEDRAYRAEQRERQRKLDSETDALKTSVREAAAPRMVQSAEVYQPAVDDEGNAMPANPTAGTYKIDERFAPTGARMGALPDRAAAEGAATAANTPDAVAERVAGAYMAGGQFDKAQDVRTGARQERVAGLQEKEILAEQARRDLTRSAAEAAYTGGPTALAKLLTDKYDDGYTYVTTELEGGGFTIARQDKNGKTVGKPMPFGSVDEAVMFVGTRGDPTKLVEYRAARAKEERQQSNEDRRFGLQEQQFALSGQREERMARAQEASIGLQRESLGLQRERVQQSGSKSAREWMSEDDKISLQAINSRIAKIDERILDLQGSETADLSDPAIQAKLSQLQKLRATAALQARQITSAYDRPAPTAGAAAAPDPLGLRGAPAAPAAAAAPSPAAPPRMAAPAQGQPQASAAPAPAAAAPRIRMSAPRATPAPAKADPAKAQNVAVYEAEVADAEAALRQAALTRDPKRINDAATLVTQTRRALELVKQS